MMEIYVDGSGGWAAKYCYFNKTTNQSRIEEAADATNNQAEYMAVALALSDFRKEDVVVYSDSQLVVNQLNHKWHIKNDSLRALAIYIWNLCKDRQVSFKWIPREQNLAGKLLG